MILKFGYYFLLCNRYIVYLLMKKKMIRFWPILVMQLIKSRIFLPYMVFNLTMKWNFDTWNLWVHNPLQDSKKIFHLLRRHILINEPSTPFQRLIKYLLSNLWSCTHCLVILDQHPFLVSFTFSPSIYKYYSAILSLWMTNAIADCMWSRLVTLAPILVAGDTLTKIKWENHPTYYLGIFSIILTTRQWSGPYNCLIGCFIQTIDINFGLKNVQPSHNRKL